MTVHARSIALPDGMKDNDANTNTSRRCTNRHSKQHKRCSSKGSKGCLPSGETGVLPHPIPAPSPHCIPHPPAARSNRTQCTAGRQINHRVIFTQTTATAATRRRQVPESVLKTEQQNSSPCFFNRSWKLCSTSATVLLINPTMLTTQLQMPFMCSNIWATAATPDSSDRYHWCTIPGHTMHYNLVTAAESSQQ